MNLSKRSSLKFVVAVREYFEFLSSLGFSEVEALPTLMRYEKSGVSVDVYHGRQSYEVGAGITAYGVRYTIPQIIRHSDSELAEKYRRKSVTTSEEVAVAVEELSLLTKRYCRLALEGDRSLFSALENERKISTKEYELDVLARQTRPKALEAFRKKDYSKAVELYSRIEKRLTPAEIKKLSIAKKYAE